MNYLPHAPFSRPVNRRKFLKSALAASCLAPTLLRGSAEDNKKLILSAPVTHSDWVMMAGAIWGEAGLRHMLDVCKACGWSRLYWRTLDGGRALYKSKLVLPEGKWDAGNMWDPKTEADKKWLEKTTPSMTWPERWAVAKKMEVYDYAHFDSLAAAIDYGHKIGLQIHAWVSINEDDHGWGLQSEFSKEHPQYRWQHRDGRSYNSQLSFAYPEVRKYKIAMLDELLRHYAIDGLFLDWIRTGDVRDNPQTDTNGVADFGYEKILADSFQKKFGINPHDLPNGDERWVRWRSEPQTEFMRAARKLVNSKRRRVPLAVMVGQPWSYRGIYDPIDGNLRGYLIDTTAWAREGLMDSVVGAGYYRSGGTPELAYHALKKETEGLVDVWCYAWVPETPAEFEQDFNLAESLGAKQILFWEANYIDARAQAAELKTVMAQHAMF